MKKALLLLLILILTVALAACSSGDGTRQSVVSTESAGAVEQSDPPPLQTQTESTAGAETGAVADDSQSDANEPKEDVPSAGEAMPGKILLVYFSHTGSTRSVAEHIASRIDVDVAEIIPINSYPINYSDNLAVAQQELEDNARPSIRFDQADLAAYDTIILGYPIWHGTFPRPVATFLESYDLSGKAIAPFCTSGSTSIGGSVGELEELAPDTAILTGLGITSNTLGNAEELVNGWLMELELL